jgi:calcium-dependent protein kinase
VLTRLKKFKGVSTLKKACLNILIKSISTNSDVENLKSMFQMMDKDNTGDISLNELRTALIQAKIPYDEKEL